MSVNMALALVLTFGAALMDLYYEKVDNRLIVCGWGFGLLLRLSENGVKGGTVFLTGAAFPILLLFGLFYFRMLGPGDIKLFSVIGGLLGVSAVGRCMLYSFLIGGFFCAFLLIRRGICLQRVHYFLDYLKTAVQTGNPSPYYRTGRHSENLHFTLPILAGIVLLAGGC